MTPTDDSTELTRLLSESAGGDRAAFERLYRRCAPRLYAFARRLLRRPELADEVLQDCMISIWRHASDFRPEVASPLTWMCNIVRNRCFDLLRRPEIEILAEVESEETAPDTLERLAGDVDARAIRALVATLAPRERQMIALAYYRGMSHAEIAAHVGEPLGTVKTLIRRGLAQLREAYDAAPRARPITYAQPPCGTVRSGIGCKSVLLPAFTT